MCKKKIQQNLRIQETNLTFIPGKTLDLRRENEGTYTDLVVSVPTPLKNMTLSVGMMAFPTEWENKWHVPNHQPAINVKENNPVHIPYPMYCNNSPFIFQGRSNNVLLVKIEVPVWYTIYHRC